MGTTVRRAMIAPARATLVLGAVVLAVLVVAAPAGAQEPGATTVPASSAPGATSAPDETGGAGATTSSVPEDSGDLGRIIPLPDSGREPETPGDRGGWQQLSLFIAVCAAIVGISVWVWWRSRRIRAARRAEGVDRVEWARTHGGDVRRPDQEVGSG